MSSFAQRLYTARKNKKMTQKQLADQLGVQQGQISLYETDKDEPPVVVKERIAELLDVSLDFLNGRTPDESGHLSDLDTSLTMAHRIKVIRTYYQKSQMDFAHDLGISQSALSSLENGSTSPSAEVLQKLGRMGFALEWILYGENNQPESAAIVLEQSANDWEIAQIQKLLLKLPQEKLKMWRQMLEIYIAAETKRD
jgi:transcriptional regulator with XRE-family HTH domain